jgi:hypothetical protein
VRTVNGRRYFFTEYSVRQQSLELGTGGMRVSFAQAAQSQRFGRSVQLTQSPIFAPRWRPA